MLLPLYFPQAIAVELVALLHSGSVMNAREAFEEAER